MTEELSRDRAAVEAAQAAADSLDKQLTVARTELEAKQAEVQVAKTELDSLRRENRTSPTLCIERR